MGVFMKMGSRNEDPESCTNEDVSCGKRCGSNNSIPLLLYRPKEQQQQQQQQQQQHYAQQEQERPERRRKFSLTKPLTRKSSLVSGSQWLTGILQDAQVNNAVFSLAGVSARNPLKSPNIPGKICMYAYNIHGYKGRQVIVAIYMVAM